MGLPSSIGDMNCKTWGSTGKTNLPYFLWSILFSSFCVNGLNQPCYYTKKISYCSEFTRLEFLNPFLEGHYFSFHFYVYCRLKYKKRLGTVTHFYSFGTMEAEVGRLQ